MFTFLRHCQAVFQSRCTVLLFQQQHVGVPVSPQPGQHLLLSVFWILAILGGVMWYLIKGLICIYLSLLT